MPDVTYDLDSMDGFVRDIDEQIEAWYEVCGRIRQSANTIRAGFLGEGGDAFEAMHTDWQREAAIRVDDLTALRRRVATTAANYREAQRRNIELFQDL